MTIGEDKNVDAQLIREEAYEVIAKYHNLPVEAVDLALIEKAFQDFADFPSSIHAGAASGGGKWCWRKPGANGGGGSDHGWSG